MFLHYTISATLIGSLYDECQATIEIAHNQESTMDDIRTKILSIYTFTLKMNRKIDSVTGEERPCTFSVDYAVDALCDMKSDEDITTHSTKHIWNTPIDSYSKQDAMMMKKIEYNHKEDHDRKRFERCVAPETGAKRNSRCSAYHKLNHWKGGYQCEFNPKHREWKQSKNNDVNIAQNIKDENTNNVARPYVQ